MEAIRQTIRVPENTVTGDPSARKYVSPAKKSQEGFSPLLAAFRSTASEEPVKQRRAAQRASLCALIPRPLGRVKFITFLRRKNPAPLRSKEHTGLLHTASFKQAAPRHFRKLTERGKAWYDERDHPF
jgi:hypothetical protein